MEPTKELIDELRRESIERARRTKPADKLMQGPKLFDLACRV